MRFTSTLTERLLNLQSQGNVREDKQALPDTEYSYIVSAYVDGKWTPMYKSDVVTVRTKAE